MIRWLSPNDLVAWRDIRAEALRLCPTAFLTTLAEFEAESDEFVMGQLAKGRVLGAFDGDTLMGVAAYVRMSAKALTQHRAEIGAVYVRPAARGTGIAAGLMRHLEEYARVEGVTQLELYVEVGNDTALRFYEALGYTRQGLLPNAVKRDGVGHDDFFMVRALER